MRAPLATSLKIQKTDIDARMRRYDVRGHYSKATYLDRGHVSCFTTPLHAK
jgi:hypothetical protein